MKSRMVAIIFCGFVMMIFGMLFSFYGYENTWGLWNITTMSPHFADLRPITGGAESYAQGLDPMIENPGDPWNRRLNYPRLWQSLYLIGVNQNHTTFIGVTFILLFLIGVCLILPHVSMGTNILVWAAVLSPSTLLGVERANIDLFMFFLVSVSVVTANRWRLLSLFAILFGFVLKLFPLFGCAILLKENRSVFFKYGLTVCTFVILYIFWMYSDLLLIREGTPSSTFLSYGMNVFWMQSMAYNVTVGLYTEIFSYITVLILFFNAFTALSKDDFQVEMQEQSVSLDAFRAGAAIFTGTFLLGTNWDYRLMFLILTIPQLVIWVGCRSRYISASSVVILISIFFSMWHLLVIKFMRYATVSNFYFIFMLDELFNWGIFAGLLYLFSWSLPNWVKEYVQNTESPIA